MIKIDNNIEQIKKEIVIPCKSGKFVYVCCSRKYQVKEIASSLEKLSVSAKRGIWTRMNGIIVIVSEHKRRLWKNFDILIEVNDGRQR